MNRTPLRVFCQDDLQNRCPSPELRFCQPIGLNPGDLSVGFMQKPALEFAARGLAQDRKNDPQPDYVGRSLPHYRIIQKIGERSMGVVYRPSRPATCRRVFIMRIWITDSSSTHPDKFCKFTYPPMCPPNYDGSNLAILFSQPRGLLNWPHPN